MSDMKPLQPIEPLRPEFLESDDFDNWLERPLNDETVAWDEHFGPDPRENPSGYVWASIPSEPGTRVCRAKPRGWQTDPEFNERDFTARTIADYEAFVASKPRDCFGVLVEMP
jgi:hypothetical protein